MLLTHITKGTQTHTINTWILTKLKVYHSYFAFVYLNRMSSTLAQKHRHLYRRSLTTKIQFQPLQIQMLSRPHLQLVWVSSEVGNSFFSQIFVFFLSLFLFYFYPFSLYLLQFLHSLLAFLCFSRFMFAFVDFSHIQSWAFSEFVSSQHRSDDTSTCSVAY